MDCSPYIQLAYAHRSRDQTAVLKVKYNPEDPKLFIGSRYFPTP